MKTQIVRQNHQSLPLTSGGFVNNLPSEPREVLALAPLIDIRNLKGVLKRRMFWLFFIPIFTVLVSLGYLKYLATHYYESRALIFIDPSFDQILQIEKVGSMNSDLDSLNSLEQAMISDSMILRVIDRLNLRNDASFLPNPLLKFAKSELPLNEVRLLKFVRDRFSASLVRPTRNIALVVYDTDASRAKLLADTFILEFESFLDQLKHDEAEISQDGLRLQAEVAYKRVLESEKELSEFRRKNPGVTVEQDHNLVAESLSKAGEELSRLIGEVITLKSRVEAVRNIDPNVDPVGIITVGKFSELDHVSELMSERTTVRSNFEVVTRQYTPRHPKYVEAQQRVMVVEQQMAQLANSFKLALVADYEGAIKNEAELRNRVAELKNNLNEMKIVSSEFRAVKQKVETDWNIHEKFQEKIGEMTVAGEKVTAITSVFSEPMVAYKTTKPNKTLVVMVAGILGCLGSLGLVVIYLFSDGPFANREQIEEFIGAPVLAQITHKDLSEVNKTMIQTMAEIILSNQNEGCQIYQILNSGKDAFLSGQVAEGLANTSAFYRSQTILIKAHEASPQGLYHLKPIETEIRGLYRLDIPTSLLLSDNAWHLLSSHCSKFKRVVIDSSAMPADSQLPIYFAGFAQQNIFVLDKLVDSREHVMRVTESFRTICKRPVVVVLVD